MNFTDTETRVLNRIQRDIPLVADPLGNLAAELELPPAAVINTIESLKERRTVRNIAGIFEPAGLGYSTTLVAMLVDPGRIDEAARAINAHPGVSHNYLREHRYNLWFTLAEESENDLASALTVLAEKARAREVLTFRNEEQYKIGLNLPVGNDDGNGSNAAGKRRPGRRDFSVNEKEAILLLQRDLPLTRDPFTEVITRNGGTIPRDELLRIGNEMKKSGHMRRHSAVIRPVHTGYHANAMTAWKPGDAETLERTARIFTKERGITHLYRRTVHGGKWEYPLFAMIHAREDGELKDIIERLSRDSGVGDYQVLTTIKELKKEKVIYFSPEFGRWRREASGD